MFASTLYLADIRTSDTAATQRPRSSQRGADLGRALALIFAFKYASQVIVYFPGGAPLSERRLAPALLGLASTIVWGLAARRGARPYFRLGFALMLLDSGLKILLMGITFLNHFMLEQFIAVIGLLSLTREKRGEPRDQAWRVLALLGLAVWGLAGLKKLLVGTYLNGEYLFSIAYQGRWMPIRSVVSWLLPPDVQPIGCCLTGDIQVPAWSSVAVIAIGVGIVVAELSPVGAYALSLREEVVGALMVTFAALAAAAALEWDFGLTNLALATLWAGERFRFVAVAMAALIAAIRVFT